MAKIVLKKVRCAYPHLFEKYGYNGQNGKYQMQVIMPLDHPQLPVLKKAILEAAREKFPGKFKDGSGKWPAALRYPLRKGEEKAEEQPEYADCVFFSSTSNQRPTVVDRNKQNVDPESGMIYGGCYVNVSLNFYAYDVSGNKGVAAGLNGVQFVKDGEAFGGSGNTVNDFDVEGDDDGDEEVDIPFDKGDSDDELI